MNGASRSAWLSVCALVALIVAAAAVVVVAPFSGDTGTGGSEGDVPSSVAARSFTPHPRIVINNDAEFATQASENGWIGDGTAEDPYVITGYSIDASGLKQAILIGNNTVHYVISGCYLGGATESGIQLYNSTNATLADNECVSNLWYGLAIVSSHLFNATNNSCEGSHCGIMVLSSNDGRLAVNNCTGNGDGIVIRNSSEIEVTGNTCRNNVGDNISYFGDGIRLYESDENSIMNNTLSTNDRYQMYLDHSNDNSIGGGILIDGTFSLVKGLQLYYSGGNIITGVQLSYTIIKLVESDNNEIRECWGGKIDLQSSSWNTVIDNDCTPNSIVLSGGIVLSLSGNNTVSGNDCSYCNKGIHLWNSDDNILSNNTCLENRGLRLGMTDVPPGYGIHCEGTYSCDRNVITGNDCSYTKIGQGSGAYGISSAGVDNVYTDNIVTHSEMGGMSVGGPNVVVRNNTIESNAYWGLGVSNWGVGGIVENNTVRFNGFIGNEGGIMAWGDGMTLTGNQVESNAGWGIRSDSSTTGKIFHENRMVNDGIFPDSQFEWVDTTNTVNDRPVHHLRLLSGGTVPSGAGQVILYQCTGVTVEGQNLSMADVGLKLEQSSSCIISSNTCCFQMTGIWLYSSSSNVVQCNNISANTGIGLKLESSNANMISENGVFDNTGYGMSIGGTNNRMWNNTFARNNGASSTYDPLHKQATSSGTNFWNTTTRGNYWADWATPDLDYDGIVDQPYVLGGVGIDYYPLISPTTPIPPAPIPELGPAAFVFLIFASIILISSVARLRRR